MLGLHLYKGTPPPSFLHTLLVWDLSFNLSPLFLAQVLPSTLLLLKCFQTILSLSSASKHSSLAQVLLNNVLKTGPMAEPKKVIDSPFTG